ncbi:MAG: SAVED domain-containing protein [bacterium]|nr:SAVED domain-containing protein [bacterium]
MAHKKVGARTEGDVYQGLFFWRQAVALLIPSSRVIRVDLEHDKTDGVDDVAVFYEPPGIDAGGWPCSVDFYQLKYHVDQRDSYSADALIDPDFIQGKSSLLQRFYHAYKSAITKYPKFRLHLASNWRWRADDALASCLREYDGALPDNFFFDGPKSVLGKVREKWRAHLGIANGKLFENFARTLRFQLDHFGRRYFREWVHAEIARAGLQPPPPESLSSSYESLVQQFLMNGPNSFDSDSLREICEREKLFAESPTASPSTKAVKIAIRSFMRFAENIEAECSQYVCVVKYFDGRHIRDSADWSNSIIPEIRGFLADSRLRSKEHHLLLDCHSSIAFLAGYELDRKSGARVFPVQKGISTEVWKPNGNTANNRLNCDWSANRTKFSESGIEIAIAVSVTRDVLSDVRDYVHKKSPAFSSLIDLRPEGGIGTQSVMGPDHAVGLADKLADIIRKERPPSGGSVHLFVAAPNALMFFLGQHRAALGKIQLYEFDFEGNHDKTYSLSICLPEK